MPPNTSNFPAKPQRLLEQWGTSPSAQQDAHPASAASELRKWEWGHRFHLSSTAEPLISLSNLLHLGPPGNDLLERKYKLCERSATPNSPWVLHFCRESLVPWLRGYLPFFSVLALSQNDILSHNCCLRYSIGPINLTQIYLLIM